MSLLLDETDETDETDAAPIGEAVLPAAAGGRSRVPSGGMAVRSGGGEAPSRGGNFTGECGASMHAQTALCKRGPPPPPHPPPQSVPPPPVPPPSVPPPPVPPCCPVAHSRLSAPAVAVDWGRATPGPDAMGKDEAAATRRAVAAAFADARLLSEAARQAARASLTRRSEEVLSACNQAQFVGEQGRQLLNGYQRELLDISRLLSLVQVAIACPPHGHRI
eukprot:4266641-Prymnesium_polylepis.1